MLTPAQAYYNQRYMLADNRNRLQKLREAVNSPGDLEVYQWGQWFTYALEYKPDLIVELGRGFGNSTALLLEALNQNQHGRIVSFCLSDFWQRLTVPRLKQVVSTDWFERLEARLGNMLHIDFKPIIGDAEKVLVLWDAHGFRVASLVLGHILPILAERDHMVIMHDISDMRYAKVPLEYNGSQIWQGMDWVYLHERFECRLILGWMNTIVDQAISISDFMTRNHSELQSADHSFHTEIGASPEKVQEMANALGEEFWNMVAHWAYFNMEALPRPYNFPTYVLPLPLSGGLQAQAVADMHSKDLLKIVAHRLWRRFKKRKLS